MPSRADSTAFTPTRGCRRSRMSAKQQSGVEGDPHRPYSPSLCASPSASANGASTFRPLRRQPGSARHPARHAPRGLPYPTPSKTRSSPGTRAESPRPAPALRPALPRRCPRPVPRPAPERARIFHTPAERQSAARMRATVHSPAGSVPVWSAIFGAGFASNSKNARANGAPSRPPAAGAWCTPSTVKARSSGPCHTALPAETSHSQIVARSIDGMPCSTATSSYANIAGVGPAAASPGRARYTKTNSHNG